MGDEVAAALAGVRERYETYAAHIEDPRSPRDADRDYAMYSAEDVPRLLAAVVQAVLAPYDRDHLGRVVRETWVAWAREQPDPKPSWLTGWDQLDAGQREVDKRIGEAIARHFREAVSRALLGEADSDG